MIVDEHSPKASRTAAEGHPSAPQDPRAVRGEQSAPSFRRGRIQGAPRGRHRHRLATVYRVLTRSSRRACWHASISRPARRCSSSTRAAITTTAVPAVRPRRGVLRLRDREAADRRGAPARLPAARHSLALYADCIKQDCPYRRPSRRPEAPQHACAPCFQIPQHARQPSIRAARFRSEACTFTFPLEADFTTMPR